MERNRNTGWANYSKHFSSDDAAAAYNDLYTAETADSRVWTRQQRALADVLVRIPRGDNSALDYACGTGRISNLLTEVDWSVIGVDSSQAMLRLAQERVPDARFVDGNMLEPSAIDDEWLGPHMLTTAIRLFLNVDEIHRAKLLEGLRLRTNAVGTVIVNNHGSSPSLRALSLRMRGDQDSNVLSSRQFERMLELSGLEVGRVLSSGLWTRQVYRMSRVGRFAIWIEDQLDSNSFGKWVLRRFGSDQLYVCTIRQPHA